MSEMTNRIAKEICKINNYNLNEPPKHWESFIPTAVAILKCMKKLPPSLTDTYWPLNNIPGATYDRPIPSLLAAWEAVIEHSLK